MKEREVLETIEKLVGYYGHAMTNRLLPRRDVMRSVKKGHVAITEDCVELDADGATVYPERYSDGFTLTVTGKERLAVLQRKAEQ